MQTSGKYLWLALGVLVVVSFFTLFWQLDVRPILIYDEGRQAVNAFEMANGGNPFVTTFEGQPDMWNTKPPLFIWLTALSIKTFGYSEWALRLPSAMAGFILVLAVFGFVRRHSTLLAGFLCALVLATSPGFIGEHAARTADFDATLTLFVFLYCSAFYNYIVTQNKRYIWVTALFFTLAFLTKSVAACFALPALLLFAILHKKLPVILRQWQWYVAFTLSFIIIALYYVIREGYNPGFITTALSNEIGQRYLSPAENHSGPWYYYFTFLGDWRRYSVYMVLLLPLGLIAFLYKPAKQPFTQMALLVSIAMFTVISSSATKLSHYDTPLYPFLGIIVGMGLYGIHHYLKTRNTYVAFAVFIPSAIMLGFCIKYVLIKTSQVDTNTTVHATLFKKLYKEHPGYTHFKTTVGGYRAGFYYYQLAYKAKGITIENNDKEFTCFVGDTLITCNTDEILFIEENFTFTPIENTRQCKALVITGFK